MRLAILQMSDTPQIEQTAEMLRRAGYEVRVCGPRLRRELERVGCDTVLAVERMISLGYDPLDRTIFEADINDMNYCDLFVEIKVRNVPKIIERWPRLQNKIVYWRVNGAQPEICPKGGDEVNLPCPIITACLWYGTERYYQDETVKPIQNQSIGEHLKSTPVSLEELKAVSASAKTGMNGMAYTFWPSYPRSADYDRINRKNLTTFTEPYCICYHVKAWGYGETIDPLVEHGVKFYGDNSPAGQVQHSEIPRITSTGKALVHMKSVDCPGWALYEGLLSGCPVVVGRLLNSRMLAYKLLEHDETCLEFGVPASLEYGRGDVDLDKCLSDIKEALVQLSDPEENRRIGEAGRVRLNELMWNAERDGAGFTEFMERWIK